MARSKIKGIHLTLEEEYIKMLNEMVRYYGYSSITAFLRVLIENEYNRFLRLRMPLKLREETMT